MDTLLVAGEVLVAVAAGPLAAAAGGITLLQYRALGVLVAGGPRRLAELAAALAVSRPTATRLCDGLAGKQLIRRRRLASDRRGVQVALTGAGRKLVTEVTRQRRAELARLLGGLPQEKRELVIRALYVVAGAAGTVPQPGAARDVPWRAWRSPVPGGSGGRYQCSPSGTPPTYA